MGMSDCEKCWSTPCECGWIYKNWSTETLSKHIASITQYRSKKEAKAIIRAAIGELDKITFKPF